MALLPIDEVHALQIQAGALGRKAGHEFEDSITQKINQIEYPFETLSQKNKHLLTGDPAVLLLNYIARQERLDVVKQAVAISTGALATSEEGKKWLSVNGARVFRCKSDLVLTLIDKNKNRITVGVSTKQCNNPTPSNAQLYFTTARGFSNLLKANGIPVGPSAVNALRQFCGDSGFRPSDSAKYNSRISDPRRFFWEEIDATGRAEWEGLFSNKQDEISKLLLQKAYMDDPFTPDYLLHKTKAALNWNETEVAIYKIDELVTLSRKYQGFCTKPYSVKKGSYKDPAGVTHLGSMQLCVEGLTFRSRLWGRTGWPAGA